MRPSSRGLAKPRDKNLYISTIIVPMVTKLRRMVAQLDRLRTHKVTQPFDHVILQNHMTS